MVDDTSSEKKPEDELTDAEKEALREAVIVQGIVPVAQRELTIMYEVGYLYIELGRYAVAEEVFAGMQALLPDSEVPSIALGHLSFSQGHYNPAMRHHQRAIEINPKSAAAHSALAEALFFLGKHREALDALRRAKELEPDGAIHDFATALEQAHAEGFFGDNRR